MLSITPRTMKRTGGSLRAAMATERHGQAGPGAIWYHSGWEVVLASAPPLPRAPPPQGGGREKCDVSRWEQKRLKLTSMYSYVAIWLI